MDNISFKANIKPINQKQFRELINTMDRKTCSVEYPWSLNEAKKVSNGYTEKICDCVFFGIVDNDKAYIAHLFPDNQDNRSKYLVRQNIIKNINLHDKNLQGILVGSKNTKKSQTIYQNLTDIFNEFQIPFSELKTAKNPIHVAYTSQDNTWNIVTSAIDKMLKNNKNHTEILNSTFEKVNISTLDKVV